MQDSAVGAAIAAEPSNRLASSTTRTTLDPERAAAAADCACYGLRKASRAISRVVDESLRPLGLKATQFSLLAAVGSSGPITIKRLADTTVMDRTTLTRNLRPLERRGLIQIQRGQDRRQRVVSLTDSGWRTLDAAFPVWEATHHEVTAAIGPDRVQRLLGDLRATIDATWKG